MRHIACLFCLVVFSAGCVSTSSYHTARPIEEGTTEIGLAVEGGTAFRDPNSGIVVTRPRVMARRGLTSQSDFGFSGGPSGTSFDYNYMFVDASPFVLSINPTLYLNWEAFLPFDDRAAETGLVLVPILALLADLEASEKVTITLGLKPGLVRESGSSGGESSAVTSAIVAGSIGLRLETGAVAILPEVNLIYSLEERDNPLLTVGIGLTF